MHKRSLGMSVYRFLGNPPRGIPGYGFPAAGTSALLAFPDSDNRVSASRRLVHQAGFPPLEILPPFRIIGIGITLQLCITGNFSIRQPLDRKQFHSALLVERCGKNPCPAPVSVEILFDYPPFPFRRMSPERPLQKFLVDVEVHLLENPA